MFFQGFFQFSIWLFKDFPLVGVSILHFSTKLTHREADPEAAWPDAKVTNKIWWIGKPWDIWRNIWEIYGKYMGNIWRLWTMDEFIGSFQLGNLWEIWWSSMEINFKGHITHQYIYIYVCILGVSSGKITKITHQGKYMYINQYQGKYNSSIYHGAFREVMRVYPPNPRTWGW